MIPGSTYEVHGIVMDAETGLPLLSGEGADKVGEDDLTDFWHELCDLTGVTSAKPLDGGFDLFASIGGIFGQSDEGDDGEEVWFPQVEPDWDGIEALLEDNPEIADHLSTATETFEADKDHGEIKMDFGLDASDLAGKKAVVFELLVKDGIAVGAHSDLTDEDQTVTIVPSTIGTEATDKTDGDHEVMVSKEVTIVDAVHYENLLPGKEYTVKGVLMDKSTDKPLMVGDKKVEASASFTPNKPNGTVELEFTFDATGLEDKEVVAFETLYKDGIEVATHADIDDAAQTVKFVNVRESTVESRAILMRLLREDGFGLKPIGGIRPSDAKAWAIRMRDRGYAFNTIAGYKRSLTAAFYTARRDDLVRREPFNFKLSDVIENRTPPKLPLTPAQTRALLDFIEEDGVYGRYLDGIVFLLGTGLRISEFCGLTDPDIDFDAGTVRVERQLLKNHGVYRVAPPKTKSGTRVVPMSPPVMIAAANIIAKRRRPTYGSIDGHKGFLCITKNGTPMVADHWEDAFHGLVAKYAKSHPAEPLPDRCTLHTLRRTFCTSAALAGMNPKDLQYIMGHSNISLTLDYYTTATPESAASELSRIAPSLIPYYLPCYI